MTAYLTMLPRLTAEESVLATTRVGIATGHVRPEDRRRIVGEWERLADDQPVSRQAPVHGPVFPRFKG